MKFTKLLLPILAIGLAKAVITRYDVPKSVVAVETVFIIEYTEICECQTTIDHIQPPALTTLTCCPSCAPISITALSQPVTSCTTSSIKTITICDHSGVYFLGEKVYPCADATCTIEYNAPCQTCYVCAYLDCWAPAAVTNKPNITVYEYLDNVQVGRWEENWAFKVGLINILIVDLERMLYPNERIFETNDFYREQYRD
jgi:hypothetical protein